MNGYELTRPKAVIPGRDGKLGRRSKYHLIRVVPRLQSDSPNQIFIIRIAEGEVSREISPFCCPDTINQPDCAI